MTTTNDYSPQKQAYITIAKALQPFTGRKGKTLLIEATTADTVAYARLDRGVVRMMSKTDWASSFPSYERVKEVGLDPEAFYTEVLESVALACASKKDVLNGSVITVSLLAGPEAGAEKVRIHHHTKA